MGYTLDETVMASPPGTVYRLRKFVRRRRGPVTAAVAVFLSLTVGLIFSTVLYFRSETARLRSEQQEQLNRRLLYAAQMTLAQQAWDAENTNRVRQLLDGLRPTPGQNDLRGFEWHYLWRLSHRDAVALPQEVAIICLAFSRDGQFLATGSTDGSIQLWDAINWQQTQTRKEHKGAVTSIAFAPTGKMLVTGGEDGSVKLWDPQELHAAITFKAHSDTVQSIAFSPLGDQLITGSKDGLVKLWDVARGRELLALRGHTGAVYAVSFSPDGKTFASGGADGLLNLWNPVDGRKRAFFKTPSTEINCLIFAAGGEWIVAGTGTGSLLSWNVTNGKQGASFEGPKGSVLSLALSPDGRNLASGGADGTIRVWEFLTRSTTAILRTANGMYPGSVFSLAFSPDGKSLVSTGINADSGKSTLTVWDVSPGQELSLPKSLGSPRIWTSDGLSELSYRAETLRLGGSFTPMKNDNSKTYAKLWDALTSRELVSAPLLRTMGKLPTQGCIAFSRSGKFFVASGIEDSAFIVWDAATGKEVLRLDKVEGLETITALALNEKILAASGSGPGEKEARLVKLWDIGTMREVGMFRSKYDSIVAIQFSPGGNLLAALSRSGRFIYGGHTCPLQFSPDDRILATDGGDLTLTLWDIQSGRERFAIQNVKDGGRKTPAKSVSSIGSMHGTILKLWSAADGNALVTLQGHDSDINCAVFSPDGRRVVTGGFDGVVKIWDRVTGQELYILTSEAGSIDSVAFSPDGGSIAMLARNGIKIWHGPRK